MIIKDAYKLDLFLEKKLVLELKSVYPLPSVYFKQIHTHLSLLNLKHGMLINFKVDKGEPKIFWIDIIGDLKTMK